MTKKETHERVKHYQNLLGLNNWDIKISFNKDKNNIAFCVADSRYLRGDINFNKKSLKEINDNDIVHELLHCLTCEIKSYAKQNVSKKKYNWFDYFEERLVSQLTKIIYTKY